MYVVTNREVKDDASGLAQFGASPNRAGANELRLAEVSRRGRGWRVRFLEDRLSGAEARRLIDEFSLPLDPDGEYFASLAAACQVTRRARENSRHVLLFVHGYNNDMADVLGTAMDLAERYDLEVVPFSWPANGGGVRGTLSYKSDKRDARASTGALERTLAALHRYLRLLTDAHRSQLEAEAAAKHPDNAEARDALLATLLERNCPFTVNALYHSMGNYLLKHMLKSSITEGNPLTFDNIVLCQADTNSLDHSLWVDTLRFRRRLFITLNEDDSALRASRLKTGSDQLARLGHDTRGLNSRNAHYVNLTGAAWVKSSHSPFRGEPVEKNRRVFEFFRQAFSGRDAEAGLRYHAEGNWYTPRRPG